MKTILVLCGVLPFFFLPTTSWASATTGKIQIEDIGNITKYNIEHTFIYETGGLGQRKHFEIPGNNYQCTLASFDLDSGTMLSCEYKKDN